MEIVNDGAVQPYESSYAGGHDMFLARISQNPQRLWYVNDEGDWGFQTYMTPVPLPAAALLLAGGILGLGTVRRSVPRRCVDSN